MSLSPLKPCSECNGELTVKVPLNCPVREKCTGCKGTGKYRDQCPFCRGSGKTPCENCSGLGFTLISRFIGLMKVKQGCENCNATGRLACTFDLCKGVGQVPFRCTPCGGSGERHPEKCKQCKGVAYVVTKCPSCDGEDGLGIKRHLLFLRVITSDDLRHELLVPSLAALELERGLPRLSLVELSRALAELRMGDWGYEFSGDSLRLSAEKEDRIIDSQGETRISLVDCSVMIYRTAEQQYVAHMHRSSNDDIGVLNCCLTGPRKCGDRKCGDRRDVH